LIHFWLGRKGGGGSFQKNDWYGAIRLAKVACRGEGEVQEKKETFRLEDSYRMRVLAEWATVWGGKEGKERG